jgi:membrane protease YdiL (CAAX protease family)
MKKFIRIGMFPSVLDVVAILLLFFVPQIIIGVVFQKYGIAPPPTSPLEDGGASNLERFLSEQELLGQFNGRVYLLSMISSIVAMVLYIWFRSGKLRIGIKHSLAGFNPNVLLVGVLWLLSAQIVLEPLVMSLPQSDSPGIGLGTWAVVTAVISAPILEELLCRGIIFETLRKGWGIGVSALISALFFGAIHGDPATIIVATVSGLIFSVLYLRTSSIFASIIVHSINNAMAFTLINFEKDKVPFREIVGSDSNYYICYGIAAAIFVAASIEAYFKLFRVKKVQPEPVVPAAEEGQEVQEEQKEQKEIE